MTEVLLRNYVEEMRTCLSDGDFSQVLALGNHILCFYPKHLETYQILAETNLEMNEMDAAADLFNRVRSADPENLVALFGLSIVHEHRGQIDEAIWHLEQAFEIQSSNAELRKELLRLYEARDGSPRGRLKLTPAALARLHARQGLYSQAILEFRALLRQLPDRLDLQVALAEALYREGRKQEAAQVSQNILENLPFCLKANLLLGSLWAENGVMESESFLKRAIALDPERSMARELQISLWDEEPAPTLPEFQGPAVSALPSEPSEWGESGGLLGPTPIDNILTRMGESGPLPLTGEEVESPYVTPAMSEEGETDLSAGAEGETEEPAVPWLQNIYRSGITEPTEEEQPPSEEGEPSIPWLEELYQGQGREPAATVEAVTNVPEEGEETLPGELALPTAEVGEWQPEPPPEEIAAVEPAAEETAQPEEIAAELTPEPEPIAPVAEFQPEDTLVHVTLTAEAERQQPAPSPTKEKMEPQQFAAIAEPAAEAEEVPELPLEPTPAETPSALPIEQAPITEIPAVALVESEPQPSEQALAIDFLQEIEAAQAEAAAAEAVASTIETPVEQVELPTTEMEAPLALEFLQEEEEKIAKLEAAPSQATAPTEQVEEPQAEFVPPIEPSPEPEQVLPVSLEEPQAELETPIQPAPETEQVQPVVMEELRAEQVAPIERLEQPPEPEQAPPSFTEDWRSAAEGMEDWALAQTTPSAETPVDFEFVPEAEAAHPSVELTEPVVEAEQVVALVAPETAKEEPQEVVAAITSETTIQEPQEIVESPVLEIAAGKAEEVVTPVPEIAAEKPEEIVEPVTQIAAEEPKEVVGAVIPETKIEEPQVAAVEPSVEAAPAKPVVPEPFETAPSQTAPALVAPSRVAIPTIKPTIPGALNKLPAWIRASLTQEPPVVAAPAPSARVVPSAEPQAVAPPPAPVPEEELPQWLQGESATKLAAETTEPAPAPDLSWLEVEAVQETQKPTAEPEEPLPDWLLMEQKAAPLAATTPEPVELPSTEPAVAEEVEPESKAPVADIQTLVEAIEPEPPPAPAQTAPPVLPVEKAKPAPAPAEARGKLPSDPETLLATARELRAAGNIAGALEYYERAMQRAPRMVSTIISDLEELVKDPKAPMSSHRLLGDAYAMGGRFKEALVQYRWVLNK